MKLYTEEQMKAIYEKGFNDGLSNMELDIEKLLATLAPAESVIDLSSLGQYSDAFQIITELKKQGFEVKV